MKKIKSRSKGAWLFDLGLVFLYSLFMVGCFFIATVYYGLGGWISFLLVVLAAASIGFLLYDFQRTVAIFAVCSLSGFVLIWATSIPLLFHSYTTPYEIKVTEHVSLNVAPSHLITELVIVFFLLSILGSIAGYYTAERTGKGEKALTLRCSKCGTWNEQDAIQCSFCGKELMTESYAARKARRS